MPRHRDLFARAALTKDLPSMQIGLETFLDRPEDQRENVRGQFFARMRPKSIGKSGWNYNLGFNALTVKSVPYQYVTGGGGGVGTGGGGSQVETRYRSLFGQTVTASVQSPQLSLWRGSQLNANFFTTAFNYSDDRRGLAPGANISLAQSLGRSADVRFDYTYDRSSLGLYGARGDSFTHYLSATLGAQLAKNVGFSTFFSRSLNDGSMYGSADLSYEFSKVWRAGLFADYTSFSSLDRDSPLNYGVSLGRQIAGREVRVNWDAVREKIYFEIGNQRY
jgi:hypothetical protein